MYLSTLNIIYQSTLSVYAYFFFLTLIKLVLDNVWLLSNSVLILTADSLLVVVNSDFISIFLYDLMFNL